MRLMIDIPDSIYNRIVEEDLKGIMSNAIANGIPLPKGHGRLIDAERLANGVNALKDKWYKDFNMNEYESGRYESYDYVETIMIEEAPTIIEADKGEEE